MTIGKIVKSNSHTDYICQIYGVSEIENAPSREDYAFGTFVKVALDNGRFLVGLIYDTVLINPDFGRLGPRLSPETELAVFSPDYLNEKATLVGITTIGMIEPDGRITQGVPRLSANTDALVERMNEDQIRDFHQENPSIRLAYAPLLLSQNNPLAFHLLQNIFVQLNRIFPEQTQLLSVLQTDLAWKSQINPLGGVQ